MRILAAFSSLLIFAAALSATDLAQSQQSVFQLQASGQGAQTSPCPGRGKQGSRFVIFDNGASVCDNASGLVWEQAPVGSVRTFTDANAYCAAKGTGWTVPDIKDFFTVVDYANANPPLPSGHPFTITVNGEYWSRTPKFGSTDEVWTFMLDYGRTFFASKSGTADYTWCVRY